MCNLINRLSPGPFCCKDAENVVRRLFVMESPNEEELSIKPEQTINYPCMGASGSVMSQHLLGLNEPLGALLTKNASLVHDIAVVETFDFPLGIEIQPKLTVDEFLWSELKRIDKEFWKSSRCVHYEKLMDFVKANVTKFPYGYKDKLERCMSLFPNLEEIVVCGFIAQSVFLFFFNQFYWPYNKRREFIITGKHINLYFVNHPAVESWNTNEKWCYSN